jgi:hypothetical protein
VEGAIIDRLARLRLVIHETRAQVVPVAAGIPWLGFVVHPTHRLEGAKRPLSPPATAVAARRLPRRRNQLCRVRSGVRGWINHGRHADSWGLRRHILDSLIIRPAEHRRVVTARQAGSR